MACLQNIFKYFKNRNGSNQTKKKKHGIQS